MEFELSYRYLVSALSQSGDEAESRKLIDGAIFNIGLPKQPIYESEDFIRICGELRKEGGRIGTIATASITQARCFRILELQKKFSKRKASGNNILY
jgi:hypothetical protein